MNEQIDVSLNGAQFVAEDETLSDQQRNWKKIREIRAQQDKKIKFLESELSKNDDQRVVEKKALAVLLELLDSQNITLRFEAAKFVLANSVK